MRATCQSVLLWWLHNVALLAIAVRSFLIRPLCLARSSPRQRSALLSTMRQCHSLTGQFSWIWPLTLGRVIDWPGLWLAVRDDDGWPLAMVPLLGHLYTTTTSGPPLWDHFPISARHYSLGPFLDHTCPQSKLARYLTHWSSRALSSVLHHYGGTISPVSTDQPFSQRVILQFFNYLFDIICDLFSLSWLVLFSTIL